MLLTWHLPAAALHAEPCCASVEDAALYTLGTREDGTVFLGQRATCEAFQRVYKQQMAGTGQRARAQISVKLGNELRELHTIYNAVQEKGGIAQVSRLAPKVFACLT